MQELDFSSDKKKKFRVKFSEEESYVLRLPSMIEARDFGRKASKAKDEFQNIDFMIDLLISLGLPEEKTKALDIEQVSELKDVVLGLKKK